MTRCCVSDCAYVRGMRREDGERIVAERLKTQFSSLLNSPRLYVNYVLEVLHHSLDDKERLLSDEQPASHDFR